MDNNIDPKVGEVWLVDLSNATGHQQRGIRPFVVTSNNKRNFSALRSREIRCLPEYISVLRFMSYSQRKTVSS